MTRFLAGFGEVWGVFWQDFGRFLDVFLLEISPEKFQEHSGKNRKINVNPNTAQAGVRQEPRQEQAGAQAGISQDAETVVLSLKPLFCRQHCRFAAETVVFLFIFRYFLFRFQSQ